MLKLKFPILWPPDLKSRHVGKDLVAGKDWRREEKGATEDEMVGWHHWLNGREFEQTLGDGEGQGNLACCSPWGYRVRHDWDTEQQQAKLVIAFWASLIAQLVKNLPAMQETQFDSWVGKICWRRDSLPTPVFWPGEFHGLYSPWGCKESDTMERLSLSLSFTS